MKCGGKFSARISTENRFWVESAFTLALIATSVVTFGTQAAMAADDITLPLNDISSEFPKLSSTLLSATSLESSQFAPDHILLRHFSGDFLPRGLKLANLGPAPARKGHESEPAPLEGLLLTYDSGGLLLGAQLCAPRAEKCNDLGQKMGRGKFGFALQGRRWALGIEGGTCDVKQSKCTAWIPTWAVALRIRAAQHKQLPQKLVFLQTTENKILFVDAQQKNVWFALSHPRMTDLGKMISVRPLPKTQLLFLFEKGSLIYDFSRESVLESTSRQLEERLGSFEDFEKLKPAARIPLDEKGELQKLLAQEQNTLFFTGFSLYLQNADKGFLKGMKRHKIEGLQLCSPLVENASRTAGTGAFIRADAKRADLYSYQFSESQLIGKPLTRVPLPLPSPEKSVLLGSAFYRTAGNGVEHLTQQGWKKTTVEYGETEIRKTDNSTFLIREDDGVVCRWHAFSVAPQTLENPSAVAGVFPCAKNIWFSRVASGIAGMWIDGRDLNIRILGAEKPAMESDPEKIPSEKAP